MLWKFFFAILTLGMTISISKGGLPEKELQASYWKNLGNSDINQAIHTFKNLNENVAKNVILFIGDGMSLGTMVTGRILRGQQNRDEENDDIQGEETITAFDRLSHMGLLKTYSVDKQSTDGAAAGTAMLCGVKTKSSRIGVSGNTKARRCASMKGNELQSILKLSAKEGKSTGIVTTSEIQDATVAAAYANVPNRRWMSDKDVPESEKACSDISAQLVAMNTDLNVVLGGGRVHMRPYGTNDEEYSAAAKRGNRRDGRNLIEEWVDSKPPGKAEYIWNKKQFETVDVGKTEHLLGLFEPFQMKFQLDKKSSSKAHDEPSLSEMTRKAIQILQQNENGYFLLVDSSLMDKAHHKSQAHYALTEFIEFENALKVAKDMTSDDDTLIIATADHGTLMNFGGGTTVRGNPILGLSAEDAKPKRALDGKVYTAVLYGSGPGERLKQSSVENLNLREVFDRDYSYQSAVPYKKGSHSSEDVVALASGPMSHLIHGVHEQSYLAHMMMYASCVGDNINHCYSAVKKSTKPSEE